MPVNPFFCIYCAKKYKKVQYRVKSDKKILVLFFNIIYYRE